MDIEKIREMFSHDKYASSAGAYIEEVGERRALCSLQLDEHHKNAVGGIMGAVHFTLADFAFAVASNAYLEVPDVVAVNATISYMNAVKGTKLYALAECLKEGRSTCFYTVKLYDDTGRDIAVVQCTGFHTKRN